MTNPAYELAKEDIGTFEWKDGHNPKVLKYFEDVGHSWVKDDETAWCAAFVGAMLKRAGMPHTGKLNARSYKSWGEAVSIDDALPGDIVVFTRGNPNGWQGHVGFYVSHGEEWVEVLGGNQANQVSVKKYSRDRLLAVRRSPNTVVMKEPRKSPAQSKTMQASATVIAGSVGTGVSAIAALDSIAQYIVLGFVGLTVLAAVFIMRERLRKWANGDR